jgi:hemerythrin-like domain-containing protein
VPPRDVVPMEEEEEKEEAREKWRKLIEEVKCHPGL